VSNAELSLQDIGRIPLAGDNAAIAIQTIDAGTRFLYNGEVHELSHAILEGHRFAIQAIAPGAALLSWNQPFGRALRAIRPGEYLCNAGTLDALKLRDLDFPLPQIANFQNAAAQIAIDDPSIRYGEQVALYPTPRTFQGYARERRGIGTRNFLVVLGTTSTTASFARRLTEQLADEVSMLEYVDGIVAVAHTEGSDTAQANNDEIVLRTLAGFTVHPNVAAILAIDIGVEHVSNRRLMQYLESHDYPIAAVAHHFYTLQSDDEASLKDCAEIMRGFYPIANAARRSSQPLSALRIGLQCGGSDAFSGISANPLAGWVAKEIIKNGGAANLAETDELIGAEGYVLANVRDRDTAQRFLDKLTVFSERIAWHGHSAEGNPTAGNKLRGLYNISLKSIGAARKKDPELRLDQVIDYAEPMQDPGFYFMDSPGNDLESVSGQVGAGCNMIFFTTGNGSITNFPFVPTIKFLTTTRRWNLLPKDLDINAGRYQDGESLEDLGRESFEYAVRIASGSRSVGERAGHSQVSIWRNWQQVDGSQLARLSSLPMPSGKPISGITALRPSLSLNGGGQGRIGLIVPTSLCAGQIALRIAESLNARSVEKQGALRFVALPHTEGCGSSTGENEDHLLRTMIGHLLHPSVERALLLEHGCERTHNNLMRHSMRDRGINPARFGYASIQLDGGIERVTEKVVRWFDTELKDRRPHESQAPLSLGLTAQGHVPALAANALAQIALRVLAEGGSVVIPRSSSLLLSSAFGETLGSADLSTDTLAYGQIAAQAGLHIMAMPTPHFVEAITGLGGSGVDMMLVLAEGPAQQGHPMIPTLEITAGESSFHSDFDLVLRPEQGLNEAIARLVDLIRNTWQGTHVPRAFARRSHNFQVTRGHLGVSL
jgi:altronate dehydratase